MQHYKQYFLYTNIVEDISKILKKDKNVVNDTKRTEKIYNILDIELLKKLKEKES